MLQARLAADPRVGDVVRRARFLTAEGRAALRQARIARIERQLDRMRPLRQAAFPDPTPDLVLARERLARAEAALRAAELKARNGTVAEAREAPRAAGLWERLRGRKSAPSHDPVSVPLPPDPLDLAREAHRRARRAHDRVAGAHAAWLVHTRSSREALLARLNRRRDRLEAALHLLHDESWLERGMRDLLRAANALCLPSAAQPDESADLSPPLARP